jgi:hypothetical protein
MVTRILFSAGDGRPVEFAQDFLRSDYARVHSEVEW